MKIALISSSGTWAPKGSGPYLLFCTMTYILGPIVA